MGLRGSGPLDVSVLESWYFLMQDSGVEVSRVRGWAGAWVEAATGVWNLGSEGLGFGVEEAFALGLSLIRLQQRLFWYLSCL